MKNAYERRREHRKLLRTAKTKDARYVKIMEIEHRMQAYKNAYRDCYGSLTKISYKSGWYWVQGRKVRTKELEEMTTQLYATLHEQELNAPEESDD